MMVQSIAGLASKAVNEGAGDEMVWVDNGNPDMRDWYDRLLTTHTNISVQGTLKPWELVALVKALAPFAQGQEDRVSL